MRSKILEEKRKLALKLRTKGHTYREIIQDIGVAKSTLAGWVKDIFPPGTEEKIRQIAQKKYREKTLAWAKFRSNQIKEKEREEQEKYAREIWSLSKKDLQLVGTSLYWAEGAKTGRWSFIFYNSDPNINQIMMRFLREVCRISDDKIKIQLVLHPQVKENRAKEYWANILRLNVSKNFNRASYSLSSASSGKRPKNRLPYGTVQIYVAGKDICNKIKGWMLGLTKQSDGLFRKSLVN